MRPLPFQYLPPPRSWTPSPPFPQQDHTTPKPTNQLSNHQQEAQSTKQKVQTQVPPTLCPCQQTRSAQPKSKSKYAQNDSSNRQYSSCQVNGKPSDVKSLSAMNRNNSSSKRYRYNGRSKYFSCAVETHQFPVHQTPQDDSDEHSSNSSLKESSCSTHKPKCLQEEISNDGALGVQKSPNPFFDSSTTKGNNELHLVGQRSNLERMKERHLDQQRLSNSADEDSRKLISSCGYNQVSHYFFLNIFTCSGQK